MPTAQEILKIARGNIQTKRYDFPASRINASDHKTLMLFSEYSIRVNHTTLTTESLSGGSATVAITLPVPIKIHEPYTVEYESVNITSLLTQTLSSVASQDTQKLGGILSNIGTGLEPMIGYGLNPYTMIKLKNVHLRRHELFWKLSPQNKQETDDIEKIIEEIRVRMHPMEELGGIVLKYPELLNFRYLGPRNPDHVFPVGPCVIENFTVDRTAADYPTFFVGTGTPTVYGLYLTVKEIRPMVREAGTNKLKLTSIL